jgi:hypothetical protein
VLNLRAENLPILAPSAEILSVTLRFRQHFEGSVMCSVATIQVGTVPKQPLTGEVALPCGIKPPPCLFLHDSG